MKNKPCVKPAVLFFGCLLLFSRCATGNDPVVPAEKERLQLAVVSGNGQKGLGGRALDGRLVVVLKDLQGNPVPGLRVNFQVQEGGGSLPDGFSPQTDANGEAAVRWVIGTGYNGIEAKVIDDHFKAAPAYFWAEG
jgi:hypothetical protein